MKIKLCNGKKLLGLTLGVRRLHHLREEGATERRIKHDPYGCGTGLISNKGDSTVYGKTGIMKIEHY